MRPALLLLLLASPLAAQRRRDPAPPPHHSPCRVNPILDGDTFTCTGGRKVRLLHIDAPESRQGVEGDSAKASLERLIHDGVNVTLELGQDSLDRYGRTLAFVWRADSLLVNEEMVRRGWALFYPYNNKDSQYDERLAAVEDSARDGRRGWWRHGSIRCRPSEFRHHECR